MNDKEQLYIPANLGQVQPTKLAIRLFFTLILVVVCSGLRWFAVVCLLFIVSTAYRPQFWWWFVVVCGGLWWFVVVCGGLWWFAVVCGGLRWFVIVCGGLSYSHTRRSSLGIPHSPRPPCDMEKIYYVHKSQCAKCLSLPTS